MLNQKMTEQQFLQLKNAKFDFTIFSKAEQPPHVHDFYECIFVLSGEAVFCENGVERPLAEYEYVFIPRGARHGIRRVEDNSILIAVFAAADEIAKLLSYFGGRMEDELLAADKPVAVQGDFNVKLKIEEIYGRILKYGDDDHLLSRLFCVEILTGVIRRLHRKNRSDEIPSTLIHAIGEMRKLENLKEGVSAIERLTNYSRPQICRLVKKYYNRTPHEYVTELRMNFAYNLIKYSNMDFGRIADSVGYSSISHFYKKFNEYFSANPSEIRKREGIHIE